MPADLKIAGLNILIIAENNYLTFVDLNINSIISSILYGKMLIVNFFFYIF